MANILIIDTHSGNREVLITLLSCNKHNLFVAEDNAQALEIVCKENLDFIFFSPSCYKPELMLLAKAAGVVNISIDKTTSPDEILKHIEGIISLQQKEANLQSLLHELSQPLMVINAYVGGCIHRLEKNVYDKKQIIDAMKIVNHHVDRAGKLINRLK